MVHLGSGPMMEAWAGEESVVDFFLAGAMKQIRASRKLPSMTLESGYADAGKLTWLWVKTKELGLRRF